MHRDPIPVAPGNGGDHAGGLTDTADFGGGQKQPQVPALAEFVQLGEARAQSWKVGLLLRLEPRQFLVECGEFGGGAFFVAPGLPEFLVLDLPLELEPTQVAEQGARLRREAIRFLVERLQTLARRPRQRLGAGAVVLLRAARGRNR